MSIILCVVYSLAVINFFQSSENLSFFNPNVYCNNYHSARDSPLCCPLFLNGSMLTVTGLMFVFPRIFTKIASKSQQKFSAQTDVGVTSCFSPDLVITISILDSKDLITPVGRFGIWTSKAMTVVALQLVESHVRYTVCVNLIYQAERWYGRTKPNLCFRVNLETKATFPAIYSMWPKTCSLSGLIVMLVR